jgi:hypothetical protein
MGREPLDEMVDLDNCNCRETITIKGDADRELKICTQCGRIKLYSNGMELNVRLDRLAPVTWVIGQLLKPFIMRD